MDTQPQPTPTVDISQITAIQNRLKLENTAKSGISWFYWIAALSLINSGILLVNGSISFVVGLAITQFIDGLAMGFAKISDPSMATIIRMGGLLINIIIAGMFALAGFLGLKRFRTAIIAGMVLYVLDGLLYLYFGEWLAVAFHVWALWSIFTGLKAINALKAEEQPKTVTII